MNKKLSLLAVSVAMVLAGCGSDDSSSANSAQQTGQFIDAKVKGLYFEAQPSGLSGWTNENGEYQSKANDTITFYLGGKDGLKIGASSERGANGIITPFESMGKYDRAVTLARILQSLDADGDTTNDSIEIPETLTTNISEQALMAVNLIQLDDFSSATKLFDVLGIPTRVSESDATDHMEAAFGGTLRGGDDAIPQFALDTNKVIRQISVTQSLKTSPDAADSILYVHADKTLSDELFNKTRGMDAMMFKFNSDKLVMLAGTNDGSLSEETAERYLNCIDQGLPWTQAKDPSGNNIYKCDDDENSTSGSFALNSSKFEYKLINKDSELKDDETEAWDTVPEAGPIGCATTEGGCTANKLNTMTDNVRDDSDDQDGSAWQREIESGSYDPVTGIHTVVRQKVECSSEQLDDCTGRTTTYLEYYYEVPNAATERYVDFTGTWNVVTTKPNCDLIARSTMTFSASGYSVKGHDLDVSGSSCSLSEMDESGTWNELPLDYWWFNQADRETKATLTELNSVVRWCDSDTFVPGSGLCSDEYFNKWEYQPAGKEWDQGILTNRKMDSSGRTHATHYMQKVK